MPEQILVTAPIQLTLSLSSSRELAAASRFFAELAGERAASSVEVSAPKVEVHLPVAEATRESIFPTELAAPYGQTEPAPELTAEQAFAPTAPREPSPAEAFSTPGAPAVPAAATGAEYDGAGVPWDARIHTETKSKNQDNTWRKKRGVDQAVYDSILASLPRQAGAAVAQPAATAPAPVPPTPQAPADAVASAPVAPPTATAGVTAIQVIQRAAQLQAAQKVSPDQVQAIAAKLGLGAFVDLPTRPDLAAQFNAELDQLVGA